MAQKVVLITGCSSGFGLLAAVEAARRGHKVVATMRNVAKRAALVVLTDLRSLVPNSISLDGLSQNFDTLQQRIDSLQTECALFEKAFQKRERPLVMGIL